MRDGCSAQALRHTVCALFSDPLTASCPAVTVTLLIVPSLALTVTPLAGLAVRAPLTGVMDSAALDAVTACADDLPDGCPADPLDVA